jgi:hypothetical protein
VMTRVAHSSLDTITRRTRFRFRWILPTSHTRALSTPTQLGGRFVVQRPSRFGRLSKIAPCFRCGSFDPYFSVGVATQATRR